MRNFKHFFDTPLDAVNSILQELTANASLWNQHKHRTVSRLMYATDDILLRYTDPATPHDWENCVNYPAWQILQQCRQAVLINAYALQRTRIARVMVTRLAPGEIVKPHRDNSAIPDFCKDYDRFHLALSDSPDCEFHCDGETFVPKQGEVFWFDHSKEHSVVNNGTEPRLTLIFDFEKIKLRAFFGDDESPVLPLQEEPDVIELSQQIQPTTSAIWPSVTYGIERLEKVWDEVEPLFSIQAKELNRTPLILAPAKQAYLNMDKSNTYRFLTVRDAGEIVGYYGTIIAPHLHYSLDLHGLEDLYWLKPSHRKLGIGSEMMKEVEARLKAVGVRRNVIQFKDHSPHRQFFESLGYKPLDISYHKMLD